MLGKHRNRDTRTPLSHEDDQPDTSRRQFLRRAGITAAVAAALSGTAEAVGISSAFAAAKGPNRRYCCISYTYSPYHCNGGRACPSGQCCFYYVGCGHSGYACIAHSCNNFVSC